MNRYTGLIVLTSFLTAQGGFSESPAPSTGTTKSEHSSAGLKAMKNAARNDSATVAVDLTSPEAHDRGAAAQALGRAGASARSSIEGLIEVLTDFATYRDDQGTHVVSVEAAQALRQIDPKATIPLKTLSKIVRTAGSPAEHQLVQGGWVSRCGTQTQALATLATLGPLAQPILPEVTRLNHKTCAEGHAFDTAQAIGTLSSEQLPRLIVLLNDTEAESRQSVANYIGEARVTGAAAALGRAMNDSSSAVRLAALEALEKLHPEGEGRVPLVKPFLQDEQPAIRRQAMRLLLKLAPDSALTLSLLKEQLKDVDPSIVLESAQAISRIQPRNHELLDALIRLTAGPDTDAGLQAAELLKTSGSHEAKVTAALEPYRERERQRQIEKALLTSTAEERSANARTLKINAIRIAKDILEEQPDHVGRVFSSATKKLYCWTTVSVASAPATLRYAWFQDGKFVYETTLVVPETTSRIWSGRHLRPGKWRVEVRSPDQSEPLASASFTVTKS